MTLVPPEAALLVGLGLSVLFRATGALFAHHLGLYDRKKESDDTGIDSPHW